MVLRKSPNISSFEQILGSSNFPSYFKNTFWWVKIGNLVLRLSRLDKLFKGGFVLKIRRVKLQLWIFKVDTRICQILKSTGQVWVHRIFWVDPFMDLKNSWAYCYLHLTRFLTYIFWFNLVKKWGTYNELKSGKEVWANSSVAPATRGNWHVWIKWCFWAFSFTDLGDSWF